MNRTQCTIAAAVLLLAAAVDAAPKIAIPLARPCNLFQPGEAVRLEAEIKGIEDGATASTFVIDYFGREVWRREVMTAAKLTLEIGALPAGYYELRVKVGETVQSASFGIAPFMQRTAEEVRNGGYRFGLKKWNYGSLPGKGEWREEDAVGACCNLGLQWTREMFNQKTQLGTVEMVTRFPMNVLLKVERFPKELYDVARYGPLAEWEAKYGKGAWTLKTLPMKEPYQQWLKGEIEKIPAEQNVYEIWNEAWDKMSPEDFATLCQWIHEVIVAVRPNAIIGPNLLGESSPYQFDARFIHAGGMKGMKMVALHPYAGSEDRDWLRKYREWISTQSGTALEIYVTEFGSHSTPQGPAKRSEQEQAQRVVRQALSLYAEDVKAFTPHWMGQTEANPTYIEDWFGFFRFSHEPKPVLMAYANAARMIDASRYVGDLWLGPGSDAMLFERNGKYTLALGTRGDPATVEIEPGVAEVTLIDMVGTERKQAVENGKLRVDIGPDWVYVVGVDPSLEAKASKTLRPDRWPAPAKPPRGTRVAKRMPAPFAADGKLEEWKGATQIGMLNPKVNGDDASGMAYVAWDAENLYLAVEMRDNELLNNKPRAKLYQQDSIELFVSTEPREEKAGYGPNDHQFFITPTSGEGKPIAGEVTDREAGIVADLKDAKFHAGKIGKGWIVELAVPWKAFPDFSPQKGAKLAFELRVNDADTSHERFKIDPVDASSGFRPEDPTRWSYLVLEE